MNYLFNFYETLKVVNNDIPEFADNAIKTQRVIQKDAKKKDCKIVYCIQSAVDAAKLEWISHAESTKEAWDILVKYYEGGEKVKFVKL